MKTQGPTEAAWQEMYQGVRDALVKLQTHATTMEAEAEELAHALRQALDDWVDCPESWHLRAYNALAPWRRRNL